MTPLEKLQQVTERLRRLEQLHKENSVEIESLQLQIKALQKELGVLEPESKSLSIKEKKSFQEIPIPVSKLEKGKHFEGQKTPPKIQTESRQSRIEQYIGGNLINKIGIVILIFGLGLFVKYAIDNGYFPPLVRLTLSFLAGLSLITIGYFLKSKYKTYSAVLFSGGMTVLYFSAYGGNIFFDPPMLPRTTSFILMVVFTIITVIAATFYNLQIIGLLGLVGAYAVPFLMSDLSGDYRLLLAYLVVINTGILLLSIRKLWKGLIYTAFFLTWLIFSFWWASDFSYKNDSFDGWLFASLFFTLFYGALIGHQYFSKKGVPAGYIGLLTLNAFIFYGFGMDFLEEAGLEKFQGLFTIGNGLIHLILSFWVYLKWTDKKLVYTMAGLFLTFVTIAIPVQFDGDVIPVLWLAEAIIMFYLARRFSIIQYELLTYIALFLSELALILIWADRYYDSKIHHDFLMNSHFLTSVLVVFGLAVLNILNEKIKVDPKEYRFPLSIGNAIFPFLFIGVLYFSFFNEIFHHFQQALFNSGETPHSYLAILPIGNLWLINYTFGFIAILGIINIKRLKNETINFITIVLGGMAIIYFLTQGMIELNDLRDDFLNVTDKSHNGFIWIRYVCYLFLGILMTSIYFIIKQSKEFGLLRKYFSLAAAFVILVILSNELTTLMQFGMGIEMESLAHKVGYSILWGVYSLLLIGIGFWKKSSQLRIAGIVLFAVTLVKVFLIDLENISTISRMVVFIALGVLMLVISYLYQRYRDVLLGEEIDPIKKSPPDEIQ